MASTRVSSRNSSDERAKRQRASTNSSGDKPGGGGKNSKSGGGGDDNKEVRNDKKKKADATTTVQAVKKSDQHQTHQQRAKMAPTTKNKSPAPAVGKSKATDNKIVPRLKTDDDGDVHKGEVRVRVRVENQLNKGYRFAQLGNSDNNEKAHHEIPHVDKRSNKSTGVRVKLEKDVRVRVRLEKTLMKGDQFARVNEFCMSNDDDIDHGTQQLQIKGPRITLRVSKKIDPKEMKKNDYSTFDGVSVANVKKRLNDDDYDDDESVDMMEEEPFSSSPPPQKKSKISQFGNDIHPKRLCIIDGCDKYKTARSGGHCLLHYEELTEVEKADIAKQNELKKLKVAPEKKRCKVEGCNKYRKSKHDGYCLTCYREHASSPLPNDDEDSNSSPMIVDHIGGPKSGKYCIFEGCMKYKQKGCVGYCLTHKAYADPEQRRIQNEIAAAESAIKKQTYNRSSLCKFEGCDKYKQANCGGYCLKHVKSKAAYDDDDIEDVTKVRIRCDNRLQNGFCVAIFSVENRAKLGLERPPQMSDDDAASDDDEDDEIETKLDAGEGVGKVSQPDFKISTVMRRKENGSLLCKAVGCPKIAQTKEDGFCRNHYNRFIISTGQCESWNCKCGEKIAITSLRCGICHRWKDGHHPVHASLPQKSVVELSPYSAIRTHIPNDADVQISDVVRKNERGRLLCKVIGCGKTEQTHNDGFCRAHFNQFAISMEDVYYEKWTCECGGEWSVRQKRCGNVKCQKWRGGKREAHSVNRSSGISADNIIEEGNWTCDNCGEEVEMRKSRCGSCHRWRGGKRQGGWVLGTASNYDSDDGGIDRTQDWTCDNCRNGEIISASQTRCGKCNRWRGGKRRPAPWECPKCNTSNPGGKRRCAGCLAWRGTDKVSYSPSETKLPAKPSKNPQGSKGTPKIVLQEPIQVATAPNFGAIDFTNLSYINYDFNQSYYESSNYSYLNGSFSNNYSPKDTECSEEKKHEGEEL